MSVQAYLHANKIIHRDLTSNNCMIRTVSLSVCVCARLYGYVHACTCVCVLGVCVWGGEYGLLFPYMHFNDHQTAALVWRSVRSLKCVTIESTAT